MTDTIYVLNGPNLNLLGMREPEIYGSDTLDDIAGMLEDRGRELGLAIDMRQSNHEGHLIDWMHDAQARGAKAILLNSGAYTHTSLALYDCIRSIGTPVIEVHISNPHTNAPNVRVGPQLQAQARRKARRTRRWFPWPPCRHSCGGDIPHAREGWRYGLR